MFNPFHSLCNPMILPLLNLLDSDFFDGLYAEFGAYKSFIFTLSFRPLPPSHPNENIPSIAIDITIGVVIINDL
ncbi:MAG: hypothetical protein ACTS78_04600 [Arsenophonus sp. NC-WZS1-MAG3]